MTNTEVMGGEVSIARWMEKGEGDLHVARILLAWDEPILTSIIGFHAQQAIEKFLKAVLVAQGIRPPRNHSISQLRDLLDSIPLVAHFPVTRFAVLERYPRLHEGESEEPGRTEVVAAVQYAEQVRRAVREFLGRAGPDNDQEIGASQNG